jgi:hypothetical protein
MKKGECYIPEGYEEQGSDADKDSKRGVPDSFYVAQLKDAQGLQRMVIRL